MVLSLLWNSVGFTDTKGIKKLKLIIEDVDRCSVTTKDIETRIKYILSNSKLELTTTGYLDPRLWIQPIIVGDELICSGAINLQIYTRITYSENHRKRSPLVGDFIFYQQNYIIKNATSKFKDSYLGYVEDMARELVVAWNEDNK